MKSSRRIVGVILVGAFSLFCHVIHAQPVLKLIKDSTNTMQISWESDLGTNYRLLSTPSLSPPVVWSPFEDIIAVDRNMSVQLADSISSISFFKLQILDGSSGLVSIFSPCNGQTVSGLVSVRIGADIGGALTEADVYLDGALIGLIQPGALDFSFDSSHFANGSHSLQVVVLDSSNNETPTSTIVVNFQNLVRWLDAETLFDTFVPIEVQSDIYPANWTVTVKNVDGTTVKTITGTTSDGNISTNWDGTDNLGNSVIAQAIYQVSIYVIDGTNSPQAADPPVSNPPSLPTNNVSSSNIGLQLNTSDVNFLLSLPPLPPGFLEQFTNSTSNTLFEASSQLQTVQDNESYIVNASSARSGSSFTILWRESSWNSGAIVLARQKITGISGAFFDGVCANLLNNIQNSLGLLEISSSRDVFGGGVTVVNNAADWSGVQAALFSTDPEVTSFYWYGHGSADGNSIGGYVTAKTLSLAFRNYFYPVVTNSVGMTSRPTIITWWPFSFVFLDGCRTGKGMLPEAFGIPKAIPGPSYSRNNKHKRAFMGWNGKVTASLLNTDSLSWSLKFWTKWLESTSISLQVAIDTANASYTPSGGILVYGDSTLTYGD